LILPGWIRVNIVKRNEMRQFCDALARLVHSRTDQSLLAKTYDVTGSMPVMA
jgi:histidinol-phosphate aminotransferase